MATTGTQRNRKRAVTTREGKIEIPNELSRLAVTYYTENKAMNAAKNKSEKARKELYGGMKERGIKSFDLTTNIDGSPIILDVEIGDGRATTEVSVEKLFELQAKGRISKENLIAMLSATVGKVEEIGGKDILAQVSSSKPGTENVKVAPHK